MHRSQYKILITLTRGEQTLPAAQIYLSLINLHRDIWSEELQGRGYEIEKIIVWDDEDSLWGGQLKERQNDRGTWGMFPKLRAITTTKVARDDLDDISARIDSETQSALVALNVEGAEIKTRSAFSV